MFDALLLKIYVSYQDMKSEQLAKSQDRIAAVKIDQWLLKISVGLLLRIKFCSTYCPVKQKLALIV